MQPNTKSATAHSTKTSSTVLSVLGRQSCNWLTGIIPQPSKHGTVDVLRVLRRRTRRSLRLRCFICVKNERRCRSTNLPLLFYPPFLAGRLARAVRKIHGRASADVLRPESRRESCEGAGPRGQCRERRASRLPARTLPDPLFLPPLRPCVVRSCGAFPRATQR